MHAALKRILDPSWIALLVTAFLLPWAIDRVFPRPAGPVQRVVLGAPDAAAAPELPAAEGYYAAADVERVRSILRERYPVQVDRAGLYELLGTSTTAGFLPLTVEVNGEVLTTVAFFENAQDGRGRPGTHRVASHVPLYAGENQVVIERRPTASGRVFLELRLLQAMDLGWFLALFLPVLGLLLLGRWLARLRPLSPRVRVVALATTFLLLVFGTPASIFAWRGKAFSALGIRPIDVALRLANLETYLDSERYAEARARKFSVCVLGDSSHICYEPDGQDLLPSLQAAVPAELEDELDLFGIHSKGLNAWDFYLLLNRLVLDPPDLVVVPVNFRSFGEKWLGNKHGRLSNFDHYLLFSEYPAALGMQLADRRFDWSHLLLRRIDYLWFDARGAPFLDGLKSWFDAAQDVALERLGARWLPGARLQPFPAESGEEDRETWNTAVTPDHELFEVFGNLSRLARRHGLPVLYYAVPMNAEAHGRNGSQLRLAENFAVIRDGLDDGPPVHWVEFPGVLPEELFWDQSEHLTAEGMRTFAPLLLEAILSVRRDLPGGDPGP